MKINKVSDCVDSISIKDFNENYFKPQKPLLIKGLASHYPAGKKWTVDYLKELCGGVNVDIFDNDNKDTSSSAFTTPDLKMKFSEYVDTIIKNEPSNRRMFLFNMFKCKPELRKDFPCPYMFNGLLGKMGYMFFGGKNIKVRIHQDIDMSNVLLTQFHGRKRVVLISPEYSDLLYRLPFNTYSLVDLDNPDYNKYPGLAYVEANEYVLEPGDALYMPSGYWHYITYLDGGFAVSYRKIAHSFKMKLIGTLSLAVYMPIDKLLNSVLGKKWLSYKERVAEARANRAIIKKIISTNYIVKEKKTEKQYSNQRTLFRTNVR